MDKKNPKNDIGIDLSNDEQATADTADELSNGKGDDDDE